MLLPGVAGAATYKGTNFDCVDDPSSFAMNSTVNYDMGQAGSTWVRFEATWSRLEPQNGVYDQTFLNGMTACIQAARTNGQYVIVDLTGPPPSWDTSPYSNPQYYEAAAHELGALYPATDPINGINALEVWNEADTSQWGGTTQQYATFLSFTYNDLHQNDPGAYVVLSGTAHFDYIWDQAIMNFTPDFDILGVHPYPRNPAAYWDNPQHYLSSSSTDSLGGLKSLLDLHGWSSRAIWATEMGFYSDSSLTDAQVSQGMTDFFNYVRTSGCSGCGNLSLAQWFLAYAPSAPDSDSQFLPFALIGPTGTPKPEYTTFSNLPFS